jgi:hypothetical protein
MLKLPNLTKFEINILGKSVHLANAVKVFFSEIIVENAKRQMQQTLKFLFFARVYIWQMQ